MAFISDASSLTFRHDNETLRLDAWGPNAIRVRSTREPSFPADNWALDETVPAPAKLSIAHDKTGTLSNGKITATLSARGKLLLTNQKGEIILEEFSRSRVDPTDPKASALRIEPREFKPRLGSESWHVTARFESLDPNEKIYGMGQYQQPYLNLKGADLELAQRNSQASIPFAISSLGYGFLWNNPSVGRAVFGKNMTTFEATSSRVLDYWVIAGDTPEEILRAYTDVTGKVPEMPEYGLGFWQCKLRYQTQEEILNVARKHKTELGLPMDVIVVDFFHWPKEGEWKFDPTFWPDPEAMIAELKSLGIELMVSIWPTVDRLSENYEEMITKGLLIRQDRGVTLAMEGHTSCSHFDATNPAARSYVWSKVKANYFDKGVRVFWLDEAEPEYTIYDFDNYRYYKGPNQMIGNSYPKFYSQGFYEGMREAGQDKVLNLVRCAWAGSQKYGALLWSGDIASSWGTFRDQLAAGLNAGLAGISWWTTDIGGFHGGDPNDPDFRELFVRWFQWGAFCPVFRLHGDREPRQPQFGNSGGSWCASGADNEVWSYGEEVFAICKAYILLREKLRDYIRGVMNESHTKGDPIIRPLFYNFPKDKKAWEVEDQYMFGSKYLVAPVLKHGQRERRVYLPEGASWKQFTAAGEVTGEAKKGGETIEVDCPIGYMPVFEHM
ncbi:glycoside hydrolase family 31 protein [Penicillium lagena]|uniref:glycoside hydrolase family 31 protein n=1 Tax=Penicillium lagena TaxID=94218 RepID=UPI0025413048|nr:glycoside hydrolase family 31 protein [Penicillium lagena]KAJ5604856.1 glycoside hydrolase family 31 protein [Penicillium lagena]